MQKESKIDRLLKLGKKGLVRTRDLQDQQIPRTYLSRLCEQGVFERVERGLYRLRGRPVTELYTLALVAKRVPKATICLLSALQVHELTTEAPAAVWVMIGRHDRIPKMTYPKLEVVRASGAARTHGVQRRRVEGTQMKLTTPAKTVADCFRYRRHVGLDVALSALRDYLRKSHAQGESHAESVEDSQARRPGANARADYTVDALVAAARADRVQTLMRPYLEALV